MTEPHSISSGTDALRRACQIISDNATPLATINGGYHRLDLRMDEYQALVSALRTPALPNGEVEMIELPRWWIEQACEQLFSFKKLPLGQLGDWVFRFRGMLKDVLEKRPARASSPAPQIAGDVRKAIDKALDVAHEKMNKAHNLPGEAWDAFNLTCETVQEAVAALPPQPQPVTPPFSRWADAVEAASLAISPARSKELDALAAEVRSYA